MASSQSTTIALIPLMDRAIDQGSKPGVSARVLYEFLGLNPTVYARWAKKNIVNNTYALGHVDWETTLLEVECRMNTRVSGHVSQDYALSIDFAKRLAMMARSAKGEEARQYFLDCERQVLTGEAHLPVKITQAQVSLAIAKALVDIEERQDAMEARQDAQEFTLAALQERQPPEGRLNVHQFLKTYSKPYLPREVLDAFKFHCRRMEQSIMFRPDGYDNAFPYYTLDTLTRAYEEATRQLSFLAGRRA